ncbi:MAG: AAA domain-containing protein [Clostridiaceae bacterium]|nr:AAA domain-containing protein [Clostridiaceae bacterium]
MNKEYAWIDFYTKFIDVLIGYIDDRAALINKIKNVYNSLNMKLPTLETDNNIVDIDPFTIYGLFNKGITEKNRIKIIRGMASEFKVEAKIPDNFIGIPVLNNMTASFYQFSGERGENDIDNLWKLSNAALKYAKYKSPKNREEFIEYFDKCIKQKGVRWNITMGLYWMRPYDYINLDSKNRKYLGNLKETVQDISAEFANKIKDLKDIPNGEEYLKICELGALELITDKKYKSFPELSFFAWEESERVKSENQDKLGRKFDGDAMPDKDVRPIHFWSYSPGTNIETWNEYYEKGIMALNWDELGDFSLYKNKKAIQDKLKQLYGEQSSYSNIALVIYQFVNEIKIGDVIFAKKGDSTVLGRGIVTSEYEFDDASEFGRANIRQVDWTHKGEWTFSEKFAAKTLTDITDYTKYVNELNNLFIEKLDDDAIVPEIVYPEYDKTAFLDEVYLSEEQYDLLVNLLNHKQNIILQGAPGTGKTFAAKRLAYSIMGIKDSSRVMMIQFHQSYSYEDFIMGYRPTKDGFELKEGPFYSFCKKAELDLENNYYFIIDEINRGNLSKIFGELFMLIENDKRGSSLKLLYSDEQFSIPDNVYLIGLMNTADRSLAMLDYALRRRFAFYEFEPAFNSIGFNNYKKAKNNSKFNQLIDVVKLLNNEIAEDETLGSGFRIGHSYFCTEKEITDSWLLSVVDYEIVPLISEYWFDEPDKVAEWKNRLKEAIQ